MRRLLLIVVLLGLCAAGVGYFLTRPATVDGARFASLEGDAVNGEMVYYAAGCSSCHKAKGSEDDKALPGGQQFVTEFGTFVAPNISPDPDHGIGTWTQLDFANAVLKGTTPDGNHYFPAFPYSTYARMSDQDVADLWAFMQTLPPQSTPSEDHALSFPFNMREGVGGWKFLYFDATPVLEMPDNERGRYLVEALGHCAECHTPRTALGGLDTSRWMAGAPNPSGQGRIPGLTPAQLDWSVDDLAFYLELGVTPDFDAAGGEMVDVINNLAKLTEDDRVAIANYIKALPPAE